MDVYHKYGLGFVFMQTYRQKENVNLFLSLTVRFIAQAMTTVPGDLSSKNTLSKGKSKGVRMLH
jgi:hypothetical protein